MSYKTSLSGSWWRKHRFFKLYMLREATVLPLAFLLCSLLAGVFSLQDAERFAQWQSFMGNPLIVAVHLIALLASLYHAFTFFQLFPRVMPIRLGDKTLPAQWLVAAQWLAVVVIIAIVLWVVSGGEP
ncbi:MAG: fumarate reductase subunit C [Idiomarina sp.]|nr:fumarate reductase subunit C [Idiomarina sp.]